MLDNKTMTEKSIQFLRDTPYDMKVMLFDLNCGKCPHVDYIATATAPYTGRPTEFHCGIDINKAIHISNSAESGGLKRRCKFNDASMEEVIFNGCRFWKATTCESEEGEFIEIQEEDAWLIPVIK